ncbi:MAG: ABC transporter ATP-binding protein [Rickettsiales bacterium]|nr:ABC transporter ATP-binding protein [Rickettsiales bacterium]OUV52819.1 MAG: hypothetical protein CBC87_05525 [Rickettsiales bacterium TMED127]
MLFNLVNVKYKFENQEILRPLNFKVNRDEHLLILGPSGCGKTTLINLMGGLLKPTSGEIFFEGKNLLLLNEDELDKIRSKNFGFIFQNFYLIKHLNIEQNIMLVQDNTNKERINLLIKELGLKDIKKKLVKNLSFGEAQRVAIARGVANEAKVIFADELTSGLDDKNTEKVMKLIFKQIKLTNSTLIVCTHDKRIKGLFKNVLEIK